MSIKLGIIADDSNYTASCVLLPELRDVTGLDNLKLATVFGYGCLVGKDSPSGKYIFFPSETVLSKEFLEENNLYRHENLNKDKTKKGFFGDDGRVKAIKFKGVVSSGLLMPINCLTYLGYGEPYSEIRVGDEFHSIDGRSICCKFRRPVSARGLNSGGVVGKRKDFDIIIPTQFRFHTSTPQFLRFLGDFTEGDRIVITEKLHGTSAVFSNVLTRRKLNLIERGLRTCGINIKDTEYRPIYSSRTVIKNSDVNLNQNGGFYGEDLWGEYAAKLDGKIEKGITLYGEIVGYTKNGGYIQQGYSYGCKEGENKFYCYRITYTTPDGNVIEFTDSQIRSYCNSRDIEVVPLVEMSMDRMYNSSSRIEQIVEYFSKDIETMCAYNEQKVPREGVVIRRDGQDTFSAYKLKSQLFLTYETKKWLLDNKIPVGGLYMRDAEDNRKDSIVKYEILNKLIKENYITGVFDDRNQVVKMWREAGLRCYQVAYGDF